MRTSTRALAALGVAALTVMVAACGGSGSTSSNARGATRTLDVTMTDNAYQPVELRVAKGETVTLKFKNNGTVAHEAILGDDAAQMKHHSEMSTATSTAHGGGHDNMSGSASSSGAITVEPGKTGELTHMFTESGTTLIGCHEPGHWEAGMKATVVVT